MHFTEELYENAIIDLFQNTLGYNYIYAPDLERDFQSPLYCDMLESCLAIINKNLPSDAINETIYKLQNFETGTILQKN